MGADLLGYFAYVPEKGHSKIIKDHAKKVDAIIRDAEHLDFGDDKLMDKVFKQLKKMGCQVDQILDECSGDAESVFNVLLADLATAKAFSLKGFDYRDCTWSGVKINGTKVSVLFAGERSWGDEPDGAGYIELRALARSGTFDALYNAVPWGNK